MKKIFTVFLALLISLGCLCGCNRILPQQNTAVNIDLSEPFVGFRAEKTEQITLQDFSRVDLQMLEDYQPNYAGYGVQVYFNTLTPQEQTLYRIFQYALDHTQTCIFLDDRLLGGLTIPVDDVLCCLALDNPMLEQNLKWSFWNADYTFTEQSSLGQKKVTQISGLILQINVFSQEKLDKKLEALEVAKKVIAEMPADLYPEEKAKYFYRYLGEHTQYYVPEGETEPQDYLYDALCVGKTNCDGFANAYALLCHLAQIPCMEKLYTPPQGDEVGHTWNAICLDGTWYNVDATGSAEVKEEFTTYHGFCTGDDLQQYPPDFPDRIPACPRDLIQPDCVITDTDKAGKQVKDAYIKVKKTNRNYIIVLFPDGPAGNNVMQQIADALQKSLTNRYYITKDGAAIYYIFPK